MRLISLKSAMTSMFAASGLFLASLTFAQAQSSDSNSALMARQQMRLNTIEAVSYTHLTLPTKA